MKKKLQRGFTLIELLVVITIIGILASLAIPAINGVLKQAKKVEAKVFMSSLQTAMVNYQTEYNTYPAFIPTTTGLVDGADWAKYYKVFMVPNKLSDAETGTLGNSRRIVFIGSVKNQYLDTPNDPINATTFYDPWGKSYKMWVDTDYDNVLVGLPDLNATTGTKDMPGNVAVYSFANDEGVHDKKSIGTWK